MAFFQSIKRMFGFGDDDYEEIGIDATVQPRRLQQPAAAPQQENSEDKTTESESTEQPGTPQLPVDLIFEHVVEMFNSALPDFLSRSVDPEAERKLLFETLDQSIKTHIDRLAEDATKESAAKWQAERKRLLSEIDAHKEKALKAEENGNESKNRQLSAERQKRALTERIHDLEAQVTRLEAEHEQFELENKSLVNKIRVSSIQEGDNDALRQEIATLKKQLEETKLSKSAEQGEKTDDNSEIERLKSENQTLVNDLEQLKAKQELADAMIKELNAIASTSKQQLKEKQKETDEINELVASLKAEKQTSADRLTVANSESEELKEKLKLISSQLQSTQEELDIANKNLAVAEEIQTQIERFEDIKARKDAKIQELQESRDRQIERIRILENECRSLKKTIEQNLRLQAKNESEFKATIDKLQAEKQNMSDVSIVAEPIEPMTPVPTPKPRRKSKKQEIKISAIDESLDNTDWLVATPPEGTTLRQSTKSDSTSTFGYQEPTRKNPPENEAQMSLW